VHSGEGISESPYDDSDSGYENHEEVVNTSPVNFFAPKLGKFRHFINAKKDSVTLDTGDCIFVPAYYYYQFRSFKVGPGHGKEQMINKYFGQLNKEDWSHGVGETTQTMS
jgi:hypothetical protein